MLDFDGGYFAGESDQGLRDTILLWSPTCWHQGLVSWETICSRTRAGERGDDSSAVGFELLRESNAVVDLTEAVM